jgi:hypothetical protein
MGQKEEGIGAWQKEWYGIAVSKGFYPYESQNLSDARLMSGLCFHHPHPFHRKRLQTRTE